VLPFALMPHKFTHHNDDFEKSSVFEKNPPLVLSDAGTVVVAETEIWSGGSEEKSSDIPKKPLAELASAIPKKPLAELDSAVPKKPLGSEIRDSALSTEVFEKSSEALKNPPLSPEGIGESDEGADEAEGSARASSFGLSRLLGLDSEKESGMAVGTCPFPLC